TEGPRVKVNVEVVELPTGGVTEALSNDAVIPPGCPVALRSTRALKSSNELTRTVEEPDPPTSAVIGETGEKKKSGCHWSFVTNASYPPPLFVSYRAFTTGKSAESV